MLLWTVMPMDLVMEGAEKQAAYEETELDGLRMLVEKLSPLECRIVRLVTTDPNDFLRPEVQPGTVLTYRPTL